MSDHKTNHGFPASQSWCQVLRTYLIVTRMEAADSQILYMLLNGVCVLLLAPHAVQGARVVGTAVGEESRLAPSPSKEADTFGPSGSCMLLTNRMNETLRAYRWNDGWKDGRHAFLAPNTTFLQCDYMVCAKGTYIKITSHHEQQGDASRFDVNAMKIFREVSQGSSKWVGVQVAYAHNPGMGSPLMAVQNNCKYLKNNNMQACLWAPADQSVNPEWDPKSHWSHLCSDGESAKFNITGDHASLGLVYRAVDLKGHKKFEYEIVSLPAS